MTPISSLDDLLEGWLAQLRADDHAPQTERRYRAVARRFLAWHQEVERRPATPGDFTPITSVYPSGREAQQLECWEERPML
jgi:hypothetical protein